MLSPVSPTPQTTASPSKVAPETTTSAEPPKAEHKKAPEESWADLRKKVEESDKALAAERAEKARIAAEIEELRKRPAPEEYIKKLQETEKEREEYRQQLRAASLERDPEFRKEFNDRINATAQSMKSILVAAGVDANEAHARVSKWDEEYFSEQYEALSGPAKIKFQAAWMEAERIEQERVAKLSNAESEWKQREARQAEQQKAQQEQYAAFLNGEKDAVFKELFATEGLKENQELQKAAREAVDASFQMSPRDLMHRVATARILADAVQMKDKALADLQGKFDELKKKADEQEAFIKNANGSVPRLSPTDPGVTPEDRKAIAQAFLKPRIVAPGS